MDRIGIIGFGFVGRAIYESIKEKESVVIYDKYKKRYDNHLLLKECDYIFVSVPTPTKGKGQDTTELDDVLMTLSGINYTGTVIIKSTILWKYIEQIESDFNIVVNPEFLNQNFASEDFATQSFILLGGDATVCHKVIRLYSEQFELPNANDYHITSIKEAMSFKYIHNIYHAYNVLFWNYVNECFGDARKYVKLYERMGNPTPIMSKVCADGLPGYGGACFPKDVNAMEHFNSHELTNYMKRYNERIRNTNTKGNVHEFILNGDALTSTLHETIEKRMGRG